MFTDHLNLSRDATFIKSTQPVAIFEKLVLI